MSDPAAPTSQPIPIRPTTNGTTASPSTTSSEQDWTDQVADLVVDTVDKVREKTTGPVISASRYFVFGIVAVIVAIPLIVVGIILLGRLLELFPGEIWIAYSVLGAILVLVGMVLWRQRRAKPGMQE